MKELIFELHLQLTRKENALSPFLEELPQPLSCPLLSGIQARFGFLSTDGRVVVKLHIIAASGSLSIPDS
jgi:hypothetical protein